MKRIFLLSAFPIFFALFLFSGCEKDNTDDTPAVVETKLHVKFTNDEGSEYPIYSIELRAHGNAGEADAGPIGDWQTNILGSGVQIAPGNMVEFDLAIPNSYWSEYRIGIIAEGNYILLHEQAGYVEDSPPRITHWGSHNREVYVTVVKNVNTGLYDIMGWGDWSY